jgi:hypothetical protein
VLTRGQQAYYKDLKEAGSEGVGLGSAGWGQSPVVASCKHGNEALGSINMRRFLLTEPLSASH